ncbi:MAG: LysR family transcriptional regulator [Deltaproteobacteria bacterium]|nr:LysR family transcriptional regulator [Deltaproteobacteria bacterium]
MRLDLAKLQAFMEVARTGSYGGAARRLHVTPSAISHALRKLQGGLERELFEWRGRRLSLTEEGSYLYKVCRRIFDELEEADRRMSAKGMVEVTQTLVLGATIEFGTTVLLQKLRPLLVAQPSVHVDFRFTDELTKPLLRDEIDLAVDCHAHSHPAVHRTRMFREKFVVVATTSFLEQHPVRTPLDLRGVPVLSLDREGRWWNHLLRALPHQRRPVLERVVVIDHVRGMINGTLAGYGVGLLPKYAVLGELSSGALTVLFPRLQLLEDSFHIYQKLARVDRPANRLVTEFLTELDVSEFGDAIGRTR